MFFEQSMPLRKAEPKEEIKEKLWKTANYESAWLRATSAEKIQDILRYQEIDRHPESLKWMVGDPMTTAEVKEMLEDKDTRVLNAIISGKEGRQELEGWVQLVEEDKERITRIQEKELYEFEVGVPVWEISYARYMDPKLAATEREKGLISSGVRQTCFSLGLSFNKEDHSKTQEQKDELLDPKLYIVAYTNPANVASEQVLKAAGFVNKGKIAYDLEEGDQEDNFWVLDWSFLEKICQQKEDKYRKNKL